jgi:hypothetical protein
MSVLKMTTRDAILPLVSTACAVLKAHAQSAPSAVNMRKQRAFGSEFLTFHTT